MFKRLPCSADIVPLGQPEADQCRARALIRSRTTSCDTPAEQRSDQPNFVVAQVCREPVPL